MAIQEGTLAETAVLTLAIGTVMDVGGRNAKVVAKQRDGCLDAHVGLLKSVAQFLHDCRQCWCIQPNRVLVLLNCIGGGGGGGHETGQVLEAGQEGTVAVLLLESRDRAPFNGDTIEPTPHILESAPS